MFKREQGHGKHLIMMLLACLIPIGLIMLLTRFDRGSSYYYWLVLLLCPLMHVFMMIAMHKNGNENQHNNHQSEELQDTE